MELEAYFENAKGVGVMATAGTEKVGAAIYARPHFMEDGTVAFVMRDRLTHANLKNSELATYLFKEDGPGYKGKRLYLVKVGEDEGNELATTLSRRQSIANSDEKRFVVFFKIQEVLPLIGTGK
jgi:hypothetical protein